MAFSALSHGTLLAKDVPRRAIGLWYCEMVRIAFRRRLVYRTATFAAMMTNLFFGVLRAYVLFAVAQARGGEIVGYSTTDLATYAMLTQVLLSFLAVWNHVEIATAIMTGEVVSEYCRPVGIMALYQAREVGRCLHDLLLRGMPLIVGYALILPTTCPTSLYRWFVFSVSAALGWLVCFFYRFCISSIGFWTIETRGIGALLFSCAMLLMGFLIPVGFLPEWLARLAAHTPFPSIIQTPIDVFLGKITTAQIPHSLLTQIKWTVCTAITALLVLKAGERRLIAHGG